MPLTFQGESVGALVVDPRPGEQLTAADRRLLDLYGDQERWAEKAILNVACSGAFSSDRTIGEYATEIWDAKPCPVR